MVPIADIDMYVNNWFKLELLLQSPRENTGTCQVSAAFFKP